MSVHKCANSPKHWNRDRSRMSDMRTVHHNYLSHCRLNTSTTDIGIAFSQRIRHFTNVLSITQLRHSQRIKHFTSALLVIIHRCITPPLCVPGACVHATSKRSSSGGCATVRLQTLAGRLHAQRHEELLQKHSGEGFRQPVLLLLCASHLLQLGLANLDLFAQPLRLHRKVPCPPRCTFMRQKLLAPRLSPLLSPRL